MDTYNVTMKLSSYIAHPYWPELSELIEIQKRSGMNRARSDDKRESALANYLKKAGLDMVYYQKLQKAVTRHWYRVNNDDPNTSIIIPKHQVDGMLSSACNDAPAGSRFDPNDVRVLITTTDFITDRKQSDGVYSRFVTIKDARGNTLSNQKQLAKNEYIKDALATGTITIDPNEVKAGAVKALLEYALRRVGVGAARKMGYGRGDVITFEKA